MRARLTQSSWTAVSQNAIEEQIPFCVRLPRYDSRGPVGKKREVAGTESLGLGRATEVTGRYMIVRCREIETPPPFIPPSLPPPTCPACVTCIVKSRHEPTSAPMLSRGRTLFTDTSRPLPLPPLTPDCPTSAPSRGPTRSQYHALYKHFRTCCITDTCLIYTCTVRRVFSSLCSKEHWPFIQFFSRFC